MLVKMKYVCKGCGRPFERWSSAGQIVCAKCGKSVALCDNCIINPPKCDWCGHGNIKIEKPKFIDDDGRIWIS